MQFEGSQTEKNLSDAFKGESMARNKYTYYASKAKKEGYVEISKTFEETAFNEKEHGKIWFKLLHGGEIADTLSNLKEAMAGEYYEWTEMYPNFAKIAFEEGFNDVGKLFERITTVERFHHERFSKIIRDFEENKIFQRENPVFWECQNCGYHILDKAAPQECPLCAHPRAYFSVYCDKTSKI